jgi:pyridoxamine 5'-phosphate oxidase
MSDIIPASPGDDAYAADQDQGEVFTITDPIAQFADWLALAVKKEPNDANAMALATVDAAGMPDVRMVLLKDVTACGLTFYTNTESAKGVELAANPKAAAVFHWKSIRRQVRFRGPVEPVTAAEADAYFTTRARGARIGAHASAQSRPLESRFALEKAVAAKAAKFGLGDIPRPEHWSGYRIIPLQVEFWVNRPFRLHDRLCYRRADAKSGWTKEHLYP